jgi:hypothetical protein
LTPSFGFTEKIWVDISNERKLPHCGSQLCNICAADTFEPDHALFYYNQLIFNKFLNSLLYWQKGGMMKMVTFMHTKFEAKMY